MTGEQVVFLETIIAKRDKLIRARDKIEQLIQVGHRAQEVLQKHYDAERSFGYLEKLKIMEFNAAVGEICFSTLAMPDVDKGD